MTGSQMDLSKIAKLARLNLSEEELQTYEPQLSGILEYVAVLDEVDIEDVAEMPHAVDLQNVFRSDERAESLERDQALSNAPRTDGQYFQVPRILEQKSS
ncbi:MAG TPA: Asp-tRNA(Asn)/Glu-tRNA(Gln) amidotransferase GatCAB subunit C [Planctomycetaceae bacterium]|nr:Asp-tRNA(Asn)/Glu-tRNA(Gln) amidotransferase GatCAB subunit C [Planctomycetaceae bacterium]